MRNDAPSFIRRKDVMPSVINTFGMVFQYLLIALSIFLA